MVQKTKLRVLIGRMAYPLIALLLGNDKRRILRDGIHYEVDPREGLDLSLLLFGAFQRYISDVRLPPDAVIFDVGANFGLMSLRFAKLAPHGYVYAFEPTHYAFGKIKKNLSLNPALARRISLHQVFISDKNERRPRLTAYASWKVGGNLGGTFHPIHLGTQTAAEDVPATTIDTFVARHKIKRVDFLKIDTDGHEAQVLTGAKKTIATFRPLIIFEVGTYLLEEVGLTFAFFLTYFQGLGYTLVDAKSKKRITGKNYQSIIPHYYTTDVLAIPAKNRSTVPQP